MTAKDVIVSVNGRLAAPGRPEEAEQISVISTGQHYQKNGSHYVLYDEQLSEDAVPVHNLLKVLPDQVSLRKRGQVNSEMVFHRSRVTTAAYQTPYGSMVMGIRTEAMSVEETEESLRVQVKYRLEINYEHTSDCKVEIEIQARQAMV